MLRKLVMYLSAFLPMFLIMWIKEILLGVRNVLDKPWKYSWESIYSKSLFDRGVYSHFSCRNGYYIVC